MQTSISWTFPDIEALEIMPVPVKAAILGKWLLSVYSEVEEIGKYVCNKLIYFESSKKCGRMVYTHHARHSQESYFTKFALN